MSRTWRADCCVVRTPALPADAITGLLAVHTPEVDGEGLADAVAVERARAEAVLAALLARADVREALYVASPDFAEEAARWRQDPRRAEGRATAAAAWRYLARMARRATPFGLFAGSALGQIGARTELRLEAGHRRYTRVDITWLTQLVDEVEPLLRDGLRYRVNDTLHHTADALRYAEGRVEPATGTRQNAHVALEATPAVRAVLAAAPARPDTLTEAVRALDPRVPQADARAFVDALVEARVLQPELAVPVTGPDPIVGLMRQLAGNPASVGLARTLEDVHARLRALDAAEAGPVGGYEGVVGALRALRPETSARRLFHVDRYAVGRFVIGPRALRAVEEARQVLHRITPPVGDAALAHFAERYEARWGGEERPLLEVLDGERGIGFGDTDAEPSTLLTGLPVRRGAEAALGFGARERWMARRVAAAGPGGEWRLDDADLDALTIPDAPPLPDAHVFMGTLLGASAAAVDEGAFDLRATLFAGPSGARLLGRFCHGDPALRAATESHLRAEEALRPDAVFAEVVHLPEGRDGNVLARPALRAHEIRFLGHGEAPHAIPLADLRVARDPADGRFFLRSARLGREVVPRLTSAHNATRSDLAVYRFFASLERQGRHGSIAWSWGALAGAPYLPRVRWKNLVLATAAWIVAREELAPLLAARDADRLRAARALRAARGLPRHVAVVQADNVLPLDLESPIALDALAAVARDQEAVGLEEVYTGQWPVEGPDGPYAHELVIPFVRAPEATEAPARAFATAASAGGAPTTAPATAAPATAAAATDALVADAVVADAMVEDQTPPRVFPPGSEWLQVNLYCGSVTGDALLRAVVGPFVRRARGESAIDHWFFVRYGDPDLHLRVRLHGDPARLVAAYGALHAAVAPWIADGRVWRVTLDTYRPEVERYGGPVGIALAEGFFAADSDAVLAATADLDGDEGEDARWRLALVSVHHLLGDLGVPERERVALLRAWRDAWSRKIGAPEGLAAALDARYRTERAALAALLDGPKEGLPVELAAGCAAFAARSDVLAPLAAVLTDAERAGRLAVPTRDLAASFVHMAMNRLFRGDPNAHEVVIYDFLSRLYVSRVARRV